MKNKGDNTIGFFSFRKMFIVPFVKSIYFLFFMVINLCAFVLFLDQFAFHIEMIPGIEILERQPFLWPFLFLGIHLVWRLFCEGVLIAFRIYETLASIETMMKGGGMIELTEAPEQETLPKKIRSRKDFRKWWRNRRLRIPLNKQEEYDESKSDNVS